MSKRNDITYEILNRLYIAEGKTIKQISIELNCGYNTVKRKLFQFNLKESNSMETTRIYKSWQNMKNSCDYKSNSAFKFVGAKGIKYDESWKLFKNFYNDMKDGYSDELFLTRKNKNKDFTKENCYWATRKQISYNRTNNIIVEINGESLTVREASEKFNIKEKTIHSRYEKGRRGYDLIKPVESSNITNIPHMKKFFDNGGIKKPKEYIGFTESLKRKIRDRDDNCCQECGLENDECVVEYGMSHHIHHIDYDKANPSEENLISLCVPCHMKTNHNREYWEHYFKEIMKGRYIYQ